MEWAYPKIRTARKDGNEKFLGADFDLIDFWRWSASDLVSNATRGILAEYIVMKALGIEQEVRDEWAAYDLLTPSGIKVEVKSAAFLQSWAQKELSLIKFSTRKTLGWDAEANLMGSEPKWQSDVYVFALLGHQDQTTVNPLDLSQWRFFVVATKILAARERSQHSITLASLERFAEAVGYEAIADAVRSATVGTVAP